MKFLIISLAGIGDTLFATPLIHELRENFPESQIHALVLWPGSADLLKNNPYLNQIFQKNLIKAPLAEGIRFLRTIRKNRYDFSFNTHPQSRVHYRGVARFIGAKVRISHRYESWSFFDRFLINQSAPQDYARHAIENNLALLSMVGAGPKLKAHRYEIFLSDREKAWADEFVRTHNLAARRIIGFHVGSGGTKNLALRRWPRANFIRLSEMLLQSSAEHRLLLFGGPEETRDHSLILQKLPSGSVLEAKAPNLLYAAALLTKCVTFVSVDTALMHLAAAVQVPNQIVIETPTWNAPITPFKTPFTLVTNSALKGRNLDFYRYDGKGIKSDANTIREIMEAITPEQVFETIKPKS